MTVPYDDQTARGWPLPNPDNPPAADVQRIAEALIAADSAVTGAEKLVTALAGQLEDHFLTGLDIFEGLMEDNDG